MHYPYATESDVLALSIKTTLNSTKIRRWLEARRVKVKQLGTNVEMQSRYFTIQEKNVLQDF